jgi:hypothetical protein
MPSTEVLIDHEVAAVGAVGRRAPLADGVVGTDVALQAVLLFTGQAVLAFATPTRSPTAYLSTSEPISSMVPAIS